MLGNKTPAATPEYRDGWERAFGDKRLAPSRRQAIAEQLKKGARMVEEELARRAGQSSTPNRRKRK